MSTYSPQGMPEVTLHYGYSPPEYDLHSGQQICPDELLISYVTIHNKPVSMKVEECLFDKFLSVWEEEILSLLCSFRRNKL
jgi:hypothetical protein